VFPRDVELVPWCVNNVELTVEAYIFNGTSNLNNQTWNVLSVCSANGTLSHASKCRA
jgi:hypothetical protein